jgi:flagellar basal body-associated protein FliL
MIKVLFRIKAVRRIFGLVLTLGLLGGVWVFAYDFFKPKAAAQQKEKPAVKKEPTLDMDSFVVNLGGQNPGRYLRASLSLVLRDERDRQGIKQSNTRIRDGLIMLLSAKTAERLLAADGKSELRDEIVDQVNDAAGDELVEAVYFREFLIQ